MDPYLERHWPDVHHRLTTHSSEWLNERLGRDLIATTEERVVIEDQQTDGEAIRRVRDRRPDIRISASTSEDSDPDAGGVAIESPYQLVRVAGDPIKQSYIKIQDLDGKLITVIEYLSPTNKIGREMESYRTKREELFSAGVHLVEIDLVRAGSWEKLLEPYLCPNGARSEYRAIVRVADRSDHVAGHVFPFGLREPIPEIPIPLRPKDTVLKLPVQELLTRVYDRGRYSQRLDYTLSALPPLATKDRGWAEELTQVK